MPHNRLQSSLAHVGLALREPEEFACRWKTGDAHYHPAIWAALVATAAAGTLTYGMTMGIGSGAQAVLWKGVAFSIAAGIGWGLPLPALYILNSLSGSRLSLGTTLLAAMVTTSWGGLALMASIPIGWFVTVAIPHATVAMLIHLIVFTGVGVAMGDVFRRVMARLEPERGTTPMWWLMLVAGIGGELFVFLGLFEFPALAA